MIKQFDQDPITNCNSNYILFSNKCFGDGSEDEDGSGSGSGPSYSSYSRRRKPTRSRKSCSVKGTTRIDPFDYGSGEEDSKSSEDDSELEGPIDVEATVSSDK